MENPRVCKKCYEEKDGNKFRTRHVKGKLYVDNICMACKGTRWRAQMRLRMLEALGWVCACCGESHPDFLTLEHKVGTNHYVFDVGSTHEKNCQQLIREAEKDGWDSEKYELLCIGCNWAKGQYGQCPHRTGSTPESVIESLREKAKGIGYDHKNLSSGSWFKPGFDSRRVKGRTHVDVQMEEP